MKLKNSQSDVSFNEPSKVLTHLGYKLSKGSHRIFRQQGHEHVSIPFDRPVNKHYIKWYWKYMKRRIMAKKVLNHFYRD